MVGPQPSQGNEYQHTMKRAFKITGIILAVIVSIAIGAFLYLKLALPNTGPAPKLTIERTPERIERGKYLANHVTVCMDCHSTRDWSLFSGPPVLGNMGAGGETFDRNMGFPGVFHSRNITPAALGNWTDGEIFRAITTGVNKDGKALFPLMNYPAFGKMDEEDIRSIIAYIRTLQPIKHEVEPSKPDFPVSLLINTMPTKASLSPRPEPGPTAAYGRYLVNAAGCIDCHAKHDKGKLILGTEFGGGMEFKEPAGIVRSANITPDFETGIGNWTEQEFVKKFRSYTEPGYRPLHLGKGDLNSPMPWTMYGGMKPDDLAAIYQYLRTVPAIHNEVRHFEKKNP